MLSDKLYKKASLEFKKFNFVAGGYVTHKPVKSKTLISRDYVILRDKEENILFKYQHNLGSKS